MSFVVRKLEEKINVAAFTLSVEHTVIQEQAFSTGHFRVGYYFCAKTNLNAEPCI